MWQLLICQHICKKIMCVQHQTYPHSANFNAQPYRNAIHLLWHLRYNEQSSIHFIFVREYEKMRGQMKVAECRINIAPSHWTNQRMYNMRFMISAPEQRVFAAPSRNISSDTMKRSKKWTPVSWSQQDLSFCPLGTLKNRTPQNLEVMVTMLLYITLIKSISVRGKSQSFLRIVTYQQIRCSVWIFE